MLHNDAQVILKYLNNDHYWICWLDCSKVFSFYSTPNSTVILLNVRLFVILICNKLWPNIFCFSEANSSYVNTYVMNLILKSLIELSTLEHITSWNQTYQIHHIKYFTAKVLVKYQLKANHCCANTFLAFWILCNKSVSCSVLEI